MSMIDLRKDFQFAINNISNWKNSYERKVYVHSKLLINIMFRAINTKLVYDAFKNGEMIDSLDLEESIQYVEDFYKGMAENVMPNLIGWLRNMQNDEMVGTVNYHFYKCLAYDAEIKDDSMQELEFIYVFEQLNDACILYYIAYILAGESAKDTLESISGRTCSSYPKENLTSLKEYFQPDIAGFMNENYKNRY